MFRAACRSSSGALNVFVASGLHTHVVTGRSSTEYVLVFRSRTVQCRRVQPFRVRTTPLLWAASRAVHVKRTTSGIHNLNYRVIFVVCLIIVP